MSDNGWATGAELDQEKRANAAADSAERDYYYKQSQAQEAARQWEERSAREASARRLNGNISSRSGSDIVQTGNKPSLLYPIFILGAAWLTLYYTGLIHTALTSVPSLLESATVISIAIFLLTKKGRDFAMMVFAVLILGAIGMLALAFAGEKLGYFKQNLPTTYHSASAHSKHHADLNAGHKFAHPKDTSSH